MACRVRVPLALAVLLLLAACGSSSGSPGASPTELLRDALQALATLKSVHVHVIEQPYKDAMSTATGVLTPDGFAGTVEESASATVVVYHGKLYVQGIGLWRDYDSSGALTASIGGQWVSAPNIGQSSAEDLLAYLDVMKLAGVVSGAGPSPASVAASGNSIVVHGANATVTVNAASHQPVEISTVPSSPPFVGVDLQLSDYNAAGAVTAPPSAHDVCAQAAQANVTLPGC